MPRIIIPTPLRIFTGNSSSVEVTGNNVKEVVDSLGATFPDIRTHLLDNEGKLRKFIRLYVGDEDIQALQNEATPVEAHTVISIVPAIAGG